jgi:hypothetical protein
MNVSMMDSYNLAWKLAYCIHGLAPEGAQGQTDPILDTYHTERHTIAQELIEFDRAFSSMFSGKIGASEDGVQGLTHEEFLEVFSRGNGFTSGCGIEYPDNIAVDRALDGDKNPICGTDYLSGILRPGRRLLNVRLVRHADGYRRDLQDGMNMYLSLKHESFADEIIDFASTGRFRILCLTSSDLLDQQGMSSQTITKLGAIISQFPQSVLEQVVIHSRLSKEFMWSDIPREVKQYSEMSFYSGYEMDDVYGIYGVDPSKGALAVVRPDGYVGILADLGDVQRIDNYLGAMIRRN